MDIRRFLGALKDNRPIEPPASGWSRAEVHALVFAAGVRLVEIELEGNDETTLDAADHEAVDEATGEVAGMLEEGVEMAVQHVWRGAPLRDVETGE